MKPFKRIALSTGLLLLPFAADALEQSAVNLTPPPITADGDTEQVSGVLSPADRET